MSDLKTLLGREGGGEIKLMPPEKQGRDHEPEERCGLAEEGERGSFMGCIHGVRGNDETEPRRRPADNFLDPRSCCCACYGKCVILLGPCDDPSQYLVLVDNIVSYNLYLKVPLIPPTSRTLPE